MQQVLFIQSKWWMFCMNSTVRTLSRLFLLTTLMPTQVVKAEWLQFWKNIFLKLPAIGSSLHHNELPFRALFKNIDGCAKGPKLFSGSKDCHDLPQISISTISRPLDSILKIDEIHDLNCDQRLLYEYAVDIYRGRVDSRYASWKIDHLNQARWLTLAIRLICLWTRGAYPQRLTTKLHSLINFIVNVFVTF